MYLGGSEPTDLPENAHKFLKERQMPYVAYPPPESPEVARYKHKVDTTRAFARGDHLVVFIGQIPKLLPLNYVPWAMDLLMEEYGCKWVLQTQANGCAKAWVETEEQCQKLVENNKNLLFDVCGVWIARTPSEQRIMKEYQQSLQLCAAFDNRVQRHGAIIERLRPPQSANPVRAPGALQGVPPPEPWQNRSVPPPSQGPPPNWNRFGPSAAKEYGSAAGYGYPS